MAMDMQRNSYAYQTLINARLTHICACSLWEHSEPEPNFFSSSSESGNVPVKVPAWVKLCF